jgi:TolB-like protein
VYEVFWEEEKEESIKGEEVKSKIKPLYYVLAGIVVVLAAIIIWQLLPTKETSPAITEEVEKSIAVLPFRNDSPNQENEYFCNGMMESILTNLQKIGDLRVKSRTDVEQYRKTDKDLKTISRELKVAFILEGSVQKVGDNIRITAQLIEGNTGDHLWAENYDGKYTEEIFKFQSDIANRIASALNAVITTEEKQELATPSIINITAYDYILRARDEQWKFWFFNDTVALNNAERLYYKALKLDPNYAPGWTARGSIYWDRHGGSEEYYEENYLDSVLWYCEKASQIDPEQGFGMKGMVYHSRGDIQEAIRNYEKEIKNGGDNIHGILLRLGYIYIFNKDYQKGISLIWKALHAAKASPKVYGHVLNRLAYAYLWMGDYKEAENYYLRARDMEASLLASCFLHYYQADFQTALDCSMYCSQTPSGACLYFLGNTYFQLRDFENAVKYYRQFREYRQAYREVQLDNLYREGIALIELGMKEEGMKLIEEQLSLLEKRKKLDRPDGYDYHLAAISAYRGDHEKAIQYLQDYDKKVFIASHLIIPIYFAQYDILFLPLWNNSDFKVLLKQVLDEKEAGRAEVRELMESGDTDL